MERLKEAGIVILTAAAMLGLPMATIAQTMDGPGNRAANQCRSNGICVGADEPVFNVFKDNKAIGDERFFYSGKESGSGSFLNTINVRDGGVYMLRITVHNGANPDLKNPDRRAAKNTWVSVSLPSGAKSAHTSTARLGASGVPAISDNLRFTGSRPFRLDYQEGSAEFHESDGGTRPVSDSIVNGRASLGTIPAGFKGQGWVTLEVKADVREPVASRATPQRQTTSPAPRSAARPQPTTSTVRTSQPAPRERPTVVREREPQRPVRTTVVREEETVTQPPLTSTTNDAIPKGGARTATTSTVNDAIPKSQTVVAPSPAPTPTPAAPSVTVVQHQEQAQAQGDGDWTGNDAIPATTVAATPTPTPASSSNVGRGAANAQAGEPVALAAADQVQAQSQAQAPNPVQPVSTLPETGGIAASMLASGAIGFTVLGWRRSRRNLHGALRRQ